MFEQVDLLYFMLQLHHPKLLDQRPRVNRVISNSNHTTKIRFQVQCLQIIVKVIKHITLIVKTLTCKGQIIILTDKTHLITVVEIKYHDLVPSRLKLLELIEWKSVADVSADYVTVKLRGDVLVIVYEVIKAIEPVLE